MSEFANLSILWSLSAVKLGVLEYVLIAVNLLCIICAVFSLRSIFIINKTNSEKFRSLKEVLRAIEAFKREHGRSPKNMEELEAFEDAAADKETDETYVYVDEPQPAEPTPPQEIPVLAEPEPIAPMPQEAPVLAEPEPIASKPQETPVLVKPEPIAPKPVESPEPSEPKDAPVLKQKAEEELPPERKPFILDEDEETEDVADDDEDEDDDDEQIGDVLYENSNGFIKINYNRSHRARLVQTSERNKVYFSVIKNELLSYRGVKSRESWRFEAFHAARTCIAKMVVRGKTLYFYLALDAKQYADTRYNVLDQSGKKKYAQTPCLYRIKNNLRLRYAKQLIADMMANLGFVKVNKPYVDYAADFPYEGIESLIQKRLVKVLQVNNGGGDDSTDEDDGEQTVLQETVGEVAFDEVPSVQSVPSEQIVQEPAVSERAETYTSVYATEVKDMLRDDNAVERMEQSDLVSDRTKSTVVNIDTLGQYFENGERVTLEEMKKRIPNISQRATCVKVLARGRLGKALEVVADEFSIDAVKMIVLTGGKAIIKKMPAVKSKGK